MLIHCFDNVIALLIELINVALRLSNSFGPEIIPPRDIFLMPQVEIGHVVTFNKFVKAATRHNWCKLMPVCRAVSMKLYDPGDVNVELNIEPVLPQSAQQQSVF